MQIPKPHKPYRNKAYLKWLQTKPCCLCGKIDGEPAHHIRRSYWGAGMSQKSHDYVAVPICLNCDDKVHNAKLYIENEDRIIINNLMRYIHDHL